MKHEALHGKSSRGATEKTTHRMTHSLLLWNAITTSRSLLPIQSLAEEGAPTRTSPNMVQRIASCKAPQTPRKNRKRSRPLLRKEELPLLCRARHKLPRHRQSFPGELHRFFNLYGPAGFAEWSSCSLGQFRVAVDRRMNVATATRRLDCSVSNPIIPHAKRLPRRKTKRCSMP